MRRSKKSGFSLGETLAVLSVVLVVVGYALPRYRVINQNFSVTRCSGQLHEIGVAIRQYRNDHNGKDPWPIGALAPKYINPEQLVCPFARAMNPLFVAQAQATVAKAGRPPWSSYFMFNQQIFDQMAAQGKIAYSYSEVFEKRKVDTPLVVCRNHREDRMTHNLPPSWCFPDQPVVILRFGGAVSRTRKGGELTDNSWFGEAQDLVTL
ncbi:hypothetical protein HYZ64_01270 [Candidatus Berkelbacteria bacterium]|nr:hypothetical protein [Candidatus Berkelbacteria bacterium]